MIIRNHIGIFFFSLVLLLPLFRFGLGQLGLQNVIWATYFFGLVVPFLLLKKSNVRFFSFPVIVLLVFVFWFVSTVIYTISDDYRTKLLLLSVMPLFYFNAKFIARHELIDLLMKYIMVIFIGFSIYVLYWLAQVGFQYRIYVDYSAALFKASYLDITIYSVLLVFYTITKVDKSIFSILLAVYFSFITLISGSRFSILFLLLGLGFVAIHMLKDIGSVRPKQIFIGAIVIVPLLVLSAIYLKDHDISAYFAYSVGRLSTMFDGDASIAGRINLINESFIATNSNTFLGSGVGSSLKIVGSEYAHNMVLETWVESGLINATLLVFMTMYGLYLSLRLANKKGMYLFAGLSYMYLFFAYMKSFSVTDSRMLILFYGIVVVLSHTSHRGSSKANAK